MEFTLISKMVLAVARQAIIEAREFIQDKYGAEFVPPNARSFKIIVKGAQEAHEAIRPTRIRREPSQIKKYLNASQFRLYDLIWKRMVASQMSAAIFDSTTIDIEAKRPKSSYLLRMQSSVNVFPGFIIVYIEGRDEADEEKEVALPILKKGDELKLIEVFLDQRFTQPPPRYTEATLVKTLEQFFPGVDPKAMAASAERYRRLKIWKSTPVIEPPPMEKFQDILVQGHVLEPGKRVKFQDLVVTEFFNRTK